MLPLRTEFELTSNDPIGGKFDDVIFKYRKNGRWKYRFVQAKHKQEYNLINSKQLLDMNSVDFGLPKYFRSYCRMLKRDEYIRDCVICTIMGSMKKYLINLVLY